MPFLVRRRCEAINLFEHDIEVDAVSRLLDELQKRHGVRVTFFTVVLHVLARCLSEYPRLNRYVSGRRIYQRAGIAITFSGSRDGDENAEVYLRKRAFDPGESLIELARALHREIRRGRAGERSSVERAMLRILRLPWPVVVFVLGIIHVLDDFNLLPDRMILEDPMYASVFVANLGSVGISSAYHSLYEHGVTPLTVVVGEIRQASPLQGEGPAARRQICTLKYSYDGRVEDGRYCARFVARIKELLEHPEELVDGWKDDCENCVELEGVVRDAVHV